MIEVYWSVYINGKYWYNCVNRVFRFWLLGMCGWVRFFWGVIWKIIVKVNFNWIMGGVWI